jgi:DNA invertase Pin-like site-specific DNA recombinase
LFTDEAN